jgi:hypothetical protein
MLVASHKQYACGSPNKSTYRKGFPMEKEVSKATKAFLNALTAKEQAEQAHDEAKELLLAVYAKHGVDTLDYEEINIKISPSDRRSFDIEKLRDLISAPLFRTVTKPSVDTSAWDRAVKEGKVPAKVVKAITSVTTSVRVLVRPAKGAVKPVAKTA